MTFVFPPAPLPRVPVVGAADFPVHRIYCVGLNYPSHVAEMNGGQATGVPIFFMKPADAVFPNHAAMPYPPATENLHYEAELVVALGCGGTDMSTEAAEDAIYGYAAGLDMTRRDLQIAAREKGEPWEIAKSFDHSAPISAISPRSQTGLLHAGDIRLSVNGVVRQTGNIRDMIWSAAEIIRHLSRMVTLAPGDLVFTGTPAGVGPVTHGDQIVVQIADLEILEISIA
ncbi:fumarylacetoacetate hydrolase family protein [Acidithiobacillus ferrooxidans]|jgi:fumarylpyruvate hydrolase|uniref:fumarylacetoacetate hydrolase family protein n=5 Tax=Acidithiobacillus ferrooxidans TaxID=920 RepID=UPI000A61ABA5|nr:fumarylacetoacetate hydrolase family protein [Acidithiobacillus ferrooxidans]MCR2831859.1 fumarylacetoacetate hydrolase family protein [Acidithiobacillus ferrooxidans]